MLLINRSPGMFIVLANIVVFGVIGVEIWMWTAASTLAVAGTLALIAVTAGVVCMSAVHLIEDAAGVEEPASAVPVVPVVKPVYMTSFAVSPTDVSVAVPAAAEARPSRPAVAHV